MGEPLYVSTAQLSRALGIGATTVKRWVDEGILPAHKTAGGHRKIPLADVLRLVRENDFPRLDLALLDPTARPGGEFDESKAARDLFTILRRGDAGAARILMENAYGSGLRTAELADRILAPALGRIGAEWEAKRLDVLHEHRGSQMCAELLYYLKSLFVTPVSRIRPVAVGGAPEGHWHGLASQLAELVLLESGWSPINLGPNTPFASFRKAIAELRPRLLWLSISAVPKQRAFLTGYGKLYEDARKAGVAVAVGGRGLTSELRASMPYTTFGDGLAHLAAFAATLHPRPCRPPRGRPRRSAS
jgi:excisionase family DNA binding protein